MRGHRLFRVALLLLPCLLAGCASFYDEIFLNADGSGSYHLVLYTKKVAADEDVRALEAGVRDRAARIARKAGFTLRSVGVRRDGSLLEIDVTADFRDLSVFASPALAVAADASQWSFVVPREMSFKDGRFAAAVRRDSAPARSHPIRASFPGREARFTVHFPGGVVESNGTRGERLASWNFPLDRLCDSPVEMTADWRSDFPYLSLGLGVLLLLGLSVSVVTFFRKRAGRPSV
jgi:hypothetical protein